MTAQAPELQATETAPGQWLVAPTAPASPAAGTVVRAHAAFLTQLLAVRAGFPQARQRRRADPDVGAAAYRDGLALKRPVPGAAALDLDA